MHFLLLEVLQGITRFRSAIHPAVLLRKNSMRSGPRSTSRNLPGNRRGQSSLTGMRSKTLPSSLRQSQQRKLGAKIVVGASVLSFFTPTFGAEVYERSGGLQALDILWHDGELTQLWHGRRRISFRLVV